MVVKKKNCNGYSSSPLPSLPHLPSNSSHARGCRDAFVYVQPLRGLARLTHEFSVPADTKEGICGGVGAPHVLSLSFFLSLSLPLSWPPRTISSFLLHLPTSPRPRHVYTHIRIHARTYVNILLIAVAVVIVVVGVPASWRARATYARLHSTLR